MVIAVCALGAWEWAQFAGWHTQAKRIGLAVVFAVILLAMQFSFADITTLKNEPLILYGLWAGLIWWIVAILLVITFPASAKAWGQSALVRVLFGLLTIIPFYCGMMVLRTIGYHSDTFFGAWWLLYVMLLVWGADSGAYAFGRTMGRHKMAPKVSPVKPGKALLVG